MQGRLFTGAQIQDVSLHLAAVTIFTSRKVILIHFILFCQESTDVEEVLSKPKLRRIGAMEVKDTEEVPTKDDVPRKKVSDVPVTEKDTIAEEAAETTPSPETGEEDADIDRLDEALEVMIKAETPLAKRKVADKIAAEETEFEEQAKITPEEEEEKQEEQKVTTAETKKVKEVEDALARKMSKPSKDEQVQLTPVSELGKKVEERRKEKETDVEKGGEEIELDITDKPLRPTEADLEEVETTRRCELISYFRHAFFR